MSPLIEINDLILPDEQVILIDARGGADSYQRYLAGHLPKAIFASLDNDLAAKPADPAYGGRHPLPTPADFAITLGKWGITPQSHVIIYDDKAGANSAARLWWMLRAIGHESVQVLNGGLQAAIDMGLQLETESYAPKPTHAYPIPQHYSNTVTIEEAGSAAQNENKIVIDVRENARYLGHTEPLDLIAGHIPGAVNLPYSNNLSDDGKYLSPRQLAAMYQQIIGNTAPEDIIVHCGSGVTACHTLLGMEHAGISGPKLYVGSWSEWSRRNLPIATDK
jgi:thiosulfate/3-mercaptopyruvate sulfurtransferase